MPIRKGTDDWFEEIENGGRRLYLSKFVKKDFMVPVEIVEARWSSWTPEEQVRFAAAFSDTAWSELRDNDQRLLDFLMEKGNSRVWRSIARLVTKHRDRGRALHFLLTRVKEDPRPFGNYYQALGKLCDPESVPTLKEALLKHRQEVEQLSSPENELGKSKHHEYLFRSVYQDYLCCLATLYRLTGEESYRATFVDMLKHPAEVVRRKARLVADLSGINL